MAVAGRSLAHSAHERERWGLVHIEKEIACARDHTHTQRDRVRWGLVHISVRGLSARALRESKRVR